MGDVLEYIVDGTSGLAPGSVSGSAMVVGVCSAGKVGKSYLLGKSSDLDGLLGSGPLVDSLRDLFATGGQEPFVIAVPCEGIAGGYITPIEQVGTGAEATVSGVPGGNGDVQIKVTTAGALGTAEVSVSLDKGQTFADPVVTDAGGQLAIPELTVNVVFAGDLVLDDTYSFTVRNSIGMVSHVGSGAEITVSGTVKKGADIILQIVSGGARNEATYQLSLDGDSFGKTYTLPADGNITVGDTGVTINYPDEAAVAGDEYIFRLEAPVPSVSLVMDAIEQPLEDHDVENVYVVGATDKVDWAAFASKSDELFSKHRPTYFLLESRMPYANESLDEWVTAMIREREGFSHRWTSVCAQYGEVTDTTGQTCSVQTGSLQYP